MDVVSTPVALTTSLVSSFHTWEQAARWSVAMSALQQQDGHRHEDDARQGIRTNDEDRHAKCLHKVDFALHRSSQLGDLVCAPPLSNTRVKPHPKGGKVSCGELCMNTVAATFFPAPHKGVILYEPFGGLCAGLEMILQ